MNRVGLGIVFAVLLVYLAALAGCAPPTVRVSQEIFDFGEAEQNGIVEHTFKIYNDGNEDLEITHTKSTCGCTVAKPSKKLIKPGDFSELKVTFRVGQRKGKQVKKVFVITNDPANPKTTLALKGVVRVTMVFDPSRMRLADLKPSEPSTKTVKFTNKSDAPITVTGYEVKEKKAESVVFSFKKDDLTDLPIVLQPNESLDINVTVTLPKEQPMYFARAKILVREKPDTSPQLAITARLEGAVKTMKPIRMRKPKTGGKLKVKKKNK